jgi:YihY family inner membrane protein
MDDVTSSPDATDADAARTLSDDVPADAALADGALADGALADAVLADAALADAVLADAVLADGALAATPAEDATDAANGGAHAELISFERIEKLIDLGFERIENLNFRALGGLGVAFLLWSVIGVLGKVEAAFNRVWGVTEHRPLLRKFTDYLSVLIVVPFLLTAASSIPASEAVTRLMHAGGGAVVSHIAGLRALRVLGVIALMTLSYAFLLRFVPHTRVHTRPALVGGFVTAILALAWLRICTVFQVSVAKNSVFFGSFATVPILLSWVYVSWEILLLGAEVSFAVQNADTYRMEQGANKASPRTRLIMAVELLAETARQIRHGDGLLRVAEYLRRCNLSVRLVNDVVRELVQRGFLAEVSDQRGHFAARRDLLNLTVGETVDELLNTGVSPAEVGIPPTAGEILRESLSTTLLANLSQRVADIPPPSHDPTAQAETA